MAETLRLKRLQQPSQIKRKPPRGMHEQHPDDALWAAIGILTFLALIAVLFYLFPDTGKCMNLSYLPCTSP